jgi:uncharacterized protein YjbJ (UPF0337 family)
MTFCGIAFAFLKSTDWRIHIMSAIKDKVTGTANVAGGRLKQALSHDTGDDQLNTEGQVQEGKGNTQRFVGNIKSGLGNIFSKIGRTIRRS